MSILDLDPELRRRLAELDKDWPNARKPEGSAEASHEMAGLGTRIPPLHGVASNEKKSTSKVTRIKRFFTKRR